MRRPALCAALAAVIVASLAPAGPAAAAIPVPPSVPVTPAFADPIVEPQGPVDRTSYRMTATYDVGVTIGWASRSVRVDTLIDITNTSGGPVSRLELNTTAPVLAGMRLVRVRIDGRPYARTRVRGQTLVMPLPTVLAQGGSLRVRVVYTARAGLSTAGSDWMWSRANNVLSLYRFIPWLSRRVPFGRSNHGDPFVTPTSPDVRVRLTSDRRLTYATSGARIADQGLTQTFRARDVRDFNVTASPFYEVRTGWTKDRGTRIRVYTTNGRGKLLMRWAKRSLDTFEDWVGQYPWPVFNVAESSGGYAMESPALIWMPMPKFTDADVAYITAHETAHQWFYGAVGNDQTRDMFADEAMSDFLARSLLKRLRSGYCARDRFDRRLYEYANPCYFEIIYVQGSRWLDRLRRDMGDARFWAAVRRYYADNLHGISTNKRLLEALREEAGDFVLPRFRTRFPTLYPS